MGKFTVNGTAKARGIENVDPRLVDTIRRAAANSPYDVDLFSGQRYSGGQHAKGRAVDIVLKDPRTGKEIPNLASRQTIDIYEGFAKQVRAAQQAYHPEMPVRWGGGFSPSPKNPQGFDLMHFDTRPDMAMAYYDWENGWNKQGLAAMAKLGPGQVYSASGQFNATAGTSFENLWDTFKGAAVGAADIAGFDGKVGYQGAGALGATKIKKGMTGEKVQALQTALQAAGYDVGPQGADGKFGTATEKALAQFQKDRGLQAVGYAGPQTREALGQVLAQQTGLNNPSVSLEARDEAAARQMAAVQGSLARYNAVNAAPKLAGPTFDVPTRSLTNPNTPKLTGSVMSGPDISAETSARLSPVSYHSAPKRVLTAPSLNAGVGTVPQAQADAILGAASKSRGDPLWHSDLEALKATTGINYRANLAQTANSPFAEPSFTNRGLPPGAQASPQQVAAAKQKLGLELAANAPQRSLASAADNLAPAHIGQETPSWSDERIARDGLTPAAVAAAGQRSLAASAPQRSLVSAADNLAPPGIGAATASGASATPAGVRGTFDILSSAPKYQQAAPKQDLSSIFNKVSAPSLPSSTVSAPKVSSVSATPVGTTDIPASMRSGYPQAPTAPLTGPMAGAAARYAGVMAQQALAAAPKIAPTYQPTNPMGQQLDELAYNAGAPVQPGVMGATATPVAQPPSPFKALAPGVIGLMTAAGPLGVMGAFGRLAAASLGNVNNPRGLGYNASTAARNAAVARGVQASDLVGNGASYGRKQSDGTVTGTTSRGTGYTSSNGGREISIGGRTYEKKDNGYSLKL